MKNISYQHNALGNRVARSVDGIVVEKYLWLDKTTLVATYDKDDNLVQRFEYADGNTPVSFTQNNQRYYIVTDHLGTPRAITDNNGTMVKKVEYDSFGNVISDSNPSISIPFGFAGGLQDNDTKLVRFGFRDYDPETGRWTARDPIGFAGGDSNLYGYVFSDPVNWVDLSGLSGIMGRIKDWWNTGDTITDTQAVVEGVTTPDSTTPEGPGISTEKAKDLVDAVSTLSKVPGVSELGNTGVDLKNKLNNKSVDYLKSIGLIRHDPNTSPLNPTPNVCY